MRNFLSALWEKKLVASLNLDILIDMKIPRDSSKI